MPSTNAGKPRGYNVLISGHLSEFMIRWFEGMDVTAMPDGNTLIIGKDLDQSALFGLLTSIRDLGMQLVLVARRDFKVDEIRQLSLYQENENI
jgi:hypothetical protein